jgi:hypothetical protein
MKYLKIFYDVSFVIMLRILDFDLQEMHNKATE